MTLQMKTSSLNAPNTTLNNHKHSKRVSCESKEPSNFNEVEPNTIKDVDFGKLA